MATQRITVSPEVFSKMKKCATWDETTEILSEAIGYVPQACWDQEVNSRTSYQDENVAVIIGARTCDKAIVSIG